MIQKLNLKNAQINCLEKYSSHLNFYKTINTLRHYFLINSNFNSINTIIQQPQIITIKDVESESEQMNNSLSILTSQNFTDQQNDTQSQNSLKQNEQTNDVMDSNEQHLKQTAYFSEEDPTQGERSFENNNLINNSNHGKNIDDKLTCSFQVKDFNSESVKSKLMNKLLQVKQKKNSQSKFSTNKSIPKLQKKIEEDLKYLRQFQRPPTTKNSNFKFR